MRNKIIFILVSLVIGVFIGYSLKSYWGEVATSVTPSSALPADLFIGDNPNDASTTNPLTQSATCGFDKVLNAFYTTKISNSDPDATAKIYYEMSDDDPTNTVNFSGLNTDHPIMETGTGEGESMKVINNDGNSITLVSGKNVALGFTTVVYTLFKQEGVLIYSDQQNFPTIGPTGTMEMGYCH